MIIPGWNPGNAQKYETNVQEFHTQSINYHLFSKFIWIFWNFNMNICGSLTILKVQKNFLYQTGRDDMSYLTHTEKSIRNWHGVDPAAKKDKIVDTEGNRCWTGLTRWKKVLNPSHPVGKDGDPVWPGGKRCWSGLIFYAFRITEVGRMKWIFFWNFLNDPIRKNKQKKISPFTLEIPSQHGHRSLRYNFQEKISCLSIFRTK